jgi:hypothetical protein
VYIAKASSGNFDSIRLSTGIDLPWQASVCEHTSQLTLFLIILSLKRAKHHPRNGAILLFCMEQFCSFANSKLSQTKWRIMEHFGFLIAPAANIPFCLAFEKYTRNIRQSEHKTPQD